MYSSSQELYFQLRKMFFLITDITEDYQETNCHAFKFQLCMNTPIMLFMRKEFRPKNTFLHSN